MSHKRPGSAAAGQNPNSSYGSLTNVPQQQQHQHHSISSHHSQSPYQQQQPGSPFPFRGVDDQGKPYVQPTHGLGARAGKALTGGATYENLGGRMILRHEHSEHQKRLQKAHPCIDSSMPKSFQERKRQQRLYLARFGLNSAAASSTTGGGGDKNNTSSKSGGSVGRLRSAVNTRNSPARSNTNNSSTRAATPNISSSQSHGGGGGGALINERDIPTHDVFSTLPPDAQMVCKQTVSILESITTADARTLLTQLLREAEEKRLLQAYSGVFPTMMNDTSGYEHQQQNLQQQQQQQQQQQRGHSAASASSEEL